MKLRGFWLPVLMVAASFIGGGLASVGFGGNSRDIPSVIRARRFKVLDDKGNPLAFLGLNRAGQPQLVIFDQNGIPFWTTPKPASEKDAENDAKISWVKTMIGRSGPIAGALLKYRFDVGSFPATDPGLRALFERPPYMNNDPRWKGPYLDDPPEEFRDPWDREYQYRCPGKYNEESYDLWSLGPDENDDADDIRNWSDSPPWR